MENRYTSLREDELKKGFMNHILELLTEEGLLTPEEKVKIKILVSQKN